MSPTLKKLEAVLEHIAFLLGTDDAYIYGLSPNCNELHLLVNVTGSEANQKPLQIWDANNDEIDKFIRGDRSSNVITVDIKSENFSTMDTTSVIAAIESQHQLSGILRLESTKKRELTEDDTRLVQLSAMHLASILEEYEREEILESAEVILRQVLDIGYDLLNKPWLSLDDRLEQITLLLGDTIKAETCSIFLFAEPGYTTLRAGSGKLGDEDYVGKKYEIGTNSDTGVLDHDFPEGKTYNLCGDGIVNAPVIKEYLGPAHLGSCTSVLVIPIVRNREVDQGTEAIGWIRADNKVKNAGVTESRLGFSSDDELVARLFSGIAASSVTMGENRTLFQTLIDSIPDYIYVKDADSRFLIANTETARKMGVETPETLIGKTDTDFFPKQLAKKYREDELMIVHSKQAEIGIEELTLDLSTGKDIWLSSTKVPLLDRNGEVRTIVGVGRDITQRKIDRDMLEAFNATINVLISSTEPDEILETAVMLTRGAMSADWVTVSLLDADGNFGVLFDDPHDDQFEVDDIRDEGFSRKIISTGKPLVFPDLDEHTKIHPKNKMRGFVSSLGVPMIQEGKPIGVIWLHYKTRQEFYESTILNTQLYANNIIVAYDKVRRLKQAIEEKEANEEVVRLAMLQEQEYTLALITSEVIESLAADAVVLFVYDRFRHRLDYPPISSGLNYPELVREMADKKADHLIYRMLKNDGLYEVESNSDDPWFKDRRFTHDENIHSCIVAPLIASGDRVGVLFVNYRTHHVFSDDERERIHKLSEGAAEAIHRTQSKHTVSQSIHLLSILYQASRSISTSLNRKEILATTAEYAVLALGNAPGSFSHIATLTEEGCLEVAVTYPPEIMASLKTRFHSVNIADPHAKAGILGRSFKRDKTLNVPDTSIDPDYVRGSPDTKSQLSIPLRVEGDIIGILSIERPVVGALDRETQIILELIASQTCIALSKEAHIETSQKRIDQIIQFQGDSQKILVNSDSDQDVVGELAEAAGKIINCALIVVYSVDESTGELIQPPSSSGSVAPQEMEHWQNSNAFSRVFEMLKRNRLHLTINTAEHTFFQKDSFLEAEGIRSFAAVPQFAEDHLTGFVLIGYRVYHHFRDWEIANLKLLANQIMMTSFASDVLQRVQEYATALATIQTIGQNVARQAIDEPDITSMLNNISMIFPSFVPEGDSFYVALAEPNDRVTFPYVFEMGELKNRVDEWSDRQNQYGLTEYVMRNNQPLMLPTQGQSIDEWLRLNRVQKIGRMAKSWVGVPLRVGSQVIGVIAFQNYEIENVYDVADLDLLEAIAGNITMGIEYIAIREQFHGVVEFILDMSRARNEEEILTTLLIKAPDVLNCDSASIVMKREQDVIVTSDLTIGPSTYPFAERTLSLVDSHETVCKALQIHELVWGNETSLNDSQIRLDPVARSEIAAPIMISDQAIAALKIESKNKDMFRPNREWTNTIVRMLVDSASGALHRLRLIETESRVRNYLSIADSAILTSALVKGIVHEVKNGIVTVDTSLFDLQCELQKAQHLTGQKNMLDLLENARDHLSKQIPVDPTLLEFSGRIEPKLELVYFNKLIEGIMDFVSSVLRRDGLSYSVDYDQKLDHCLVEADETQLRSVIINLVLNAIDASYGYKRSSERVSIPAQKGKKKGRIDFRTIAEKDGAQILVTDYGPGISEDDQERVFQPFFTTKEGGSGLGLYISKVIIEENHKGSMFFKSKPSAGATFFITLPYAPQNTKRKKGRK